MTETGRDSAFQFNGTWQEFAPIAFTNLLLTIVTLGTYRFWGTTRVRRYLWSRTEFIGTPLEWTGTGKELFVGFLLAFLLFGLPLILIQFGLQALVLQGYAGAAFLAAFTLYFGVLYLFGVARFRALRYRLTRTFWRGIRGGSEERGFAFGGSYVWMTLVGGLALGLMIPWSMVQLWNRRWSAMSFGSEPIASNARHGPIMGRFLLFYAIPIAIVLIGLALVFAAGAGQAPPTALGPTIILPVLLVYIAFPLISIAFYAAFFRNAVDHMSWAGLTFGFDARTKDWLKFMLGTLGLVIITLGIGAIFIPYRNWRFLMRHLHAYGEIEMDALRQSSTALPTQGEGLLDAFDIGAI